MEQRNEDREAGHRKCRMSGDLCSGSGSSESSGAQTARTSNKETVRRDFLAWLEKRVMVIRIDRHITRVAGLSSSVVRFKVGGCAFARVECPLLSYVLDVKDGRASLIRLVRSSVDLDASI